MKTTSTLIATILLAMSAASTSVLADGSGLKAEDLKSKPAKNVMAKEPARPSLKNMQAAKGFGIANKPQAAASENSNQKENVNKAAYLKNLLKPGKPTLGGEGGSQSGGSSGQGCLNCNN